MARPLRELVSGEAYHLTSRGVDKRDVFLDDIDRERFVRRLGTVCLAREISCLAYCLMGNHVHLVLRGSASGMSAGLRDLLGGHARYFNKRHERSGHLFSARFHHVHVASDSQMHAVLRYVALNPVRAGLADHPGEWRWSSYWALTTGVIEPGTVDSAALGLILLGAVAAPRDVADQLIETVSIGLDEARLAHQAGSL